MCRYAYKKYKSHYACFRCRKVWRWERSGEYVRDTASPRTQWILLGPNPICSCCCGPLIAIGWDFKAPKQSDRAQWKKVELLVNAGFAFHSCGCGPGERPRRKSEVASFFAERQKLKNSIALWNRQVKEANEKEIRMKAIRVRREAQRIRLCQRKQAKHG